MGEFCGIPGQSLPPFSREVPEGASALDHHIWRGRRVRRRIGIFRLGPVIQETIEFRRR